MAFASSSVKTASVGNLRCIVGNWTGVMGDADTTALTLKGGSVYLCHFYNQDATSNEDRPTPCRISVSSGTITITIINPVDVTQGRFIVIYS